MPADLEGGQICSFSSTHRQPASRQTEMLPALPCSELRLSGCVLTLEKVLEGGVSEVPGFHCSSPWQRKQLTDT